MSNKVEVPAIFVDFLKKSGFRRTKPRDKILEVLLESTSHLVMDQIRDQLQEQGLVFSRGTLYNSLRVFVEAGLVSKLRTPKGRVYYEITEGVNEYHEHMICKSCEKITEIRDRNIESFFSSLCKKYGFRITHRIHEIYGVCANCCKI